MTQDTPAALPGTIAKGPLHAIHASPAVRNALLAYHDRPADDEAAAVVGAILAHQAATSAAGGATGVDTLVGRIKNTAEHWAYMAEIDNGDAAGIAKHTHAQLLSELAALAAQSPDSGAGPDLLALRGANETCPRCGTTGSHWCPQGKQGAQNG